MKQFYQFIYTLSFFCFELFQRKYLYGVESGGFFQSGTRNEGVPIIRKQFSNCKDKIHIIKRSRLRSALTKRKSAKDWTPCLGVTIYC